MSDFVYVECRARDALGVSGAAMRNVRRDALCEGRDWALVPWRGRSVVAYTLNGLERVLDGLMDGSLSVRPQGADFERVLALCSIAEVPERDFEKKLPGAGGTRCIEVWRVPLVRMVVVRKPRNPRILVCRLHGDDLRAYGAALLSRGIPEGLQRVRVRDHGKFTVNMELRGCEHEQADLWCFMGKLPRFRGRF